VTRRRRVFEPTTLPLREELEALSYYYHHTHNELEQKGLESGVRRRLEHALLETRERIDRLLEEWVPDEGLKAAWRAHLHTHAAAPDGPEAIRPLAFRGVDDAGSLVELRGRGADEFEVWVDGTMTERIAAGKDIASRRPNLRFRRNGHVIDETFQASDEALSALADFLDPGGAPPGNRAVPPWDYAAELLADGIVDVHLELTPRGHRALAARGAA
jgi:hypothetical protein